MLKVLLVSDIIRYLRHKEGNMSGYIPPFEISNMMLKYVSEIMEKIGMLSDFNNFNKMPVLRRNNRINSIHSSLAIEANSLSLSQVKDVIDGHIVVGDKIEIQEVKNAYKAYENMDNINAYSIVDLKKTHGILTFFTVKDAGKFRKGAEGVFERK